MQNVGRDWNSQLTLFVRRDEIWSGRVTHNTMMRLAQVNDVMVCQVIK